MSLMWLWKRLYRKQLAASEVDKRHEREMDSARRKMATIDSELRALQRK